MHASINKLWNAFLTEHSQNTESTAQPPAWYFCDNEADANICANLVLEGKKRATATSLWYFEQNQEPLPKVGDLDIVTDWNGVAQCIIRTTAVNLVAYKDITQRHAELEGEGDSSLEWWRDAHWAYYSREMAPKGEAPTEDMLIAFQEFECIYPSTKSR